MLTQLLISTAAAAFSQEYYNSPDGNPFLDPAFQDYVETVYGYKNPANTARLALDLRDALTSLSAVTLQSALAGRQSGGPARLRGVQTGVEASPARAPLGAHKSAGNQAAPPVFKVRDRLPGALTGAGEIHGAQAASPAPGQYYKVTFANENGPLSAFVAPLEPNALSGFKFGEYVFVSILPASADYSGLMDALSETGFKFAGEKTYFSGSAKKTFMLGWAPYSALPLIGSHPGVRRVSIEKKASGIPLKARIRFTLRAPAGERSSAFVSGFLKDLSARAGFVSESVVLLSRSSAHAKFTAFDVTGSLPVDMIRALSQSPFVAAMEFADNSL